ncbi:unnamed protein product [Miscanthus lutarioriparius]|uniref:Poly(A) RNA polymerase mitochondrial-like central palm domain-containing protein n=1 Tax=Miscanthus lutarioriparius TaxID=422564 RepID=A0A811P765_9POAL|nr:unnamed protein product [Miscanthus lutarioriparius]
MPPQDFGMVDSVHDNIVLNKCIKDILALIKPVEDDRSKRLSTIQELENCIHSLASLSGAAVKPFGSFVSDLYSKSGDLDLSVQLWNGSNHPINKRKKQNTLREVRKALLSRGSLCYIALKIDKHVLLDTCSSFHMQEFQSFNMSATALASPVIYELTTLLTSEPPILPPLNEIYEGNITEAALYNDQHLDEFARINAFTDSVISTYSGQIGRIQDDPSWMTKSYHLFVEDPVERPDNAARAVSMKGLDRIASAFNDACHKFNSLEHIDRNELLALLCTPVVGLKLGGKVIANPYPKTPQRNNQHTRNGGRAGRDQGQAPRESDQSIKTH